MSYNVTLNKKLPEQGVYDQLLGGHIVNRKQVKLYPRSGAGPFSPNSQNNIQFRLPSHGYIDTLRSYMEYTLEIECDTKTVRHTMQKGIQTLTNAAEEASLLRDNMINGYRGHTAVSALRKSQYKGADLDVGSTANDPAAYILGGYNGSSASPFRMFRILYDGEPIEYIDNYNGLVALLSMNISDSYRRSALGHMQWLSPRGSKEMILNALARGDSQSLRSFETRIAAVQFNADPTQSEVALYGWNGEYPPTDPGSSIKTLVSGETVQTRYNNIMHLPTSGIMGNSKLLPVKFLGNIDMEFQLAPVDQVLQVAGAHGCNKYVSTHVGAMCTGPRSLVFRKSALADNIISANDYRPDWGSYISEDFAYARALSFSLLQGLNETDTTRDAADASSTSPHAYLTDPFLNSVTYRIRDPVYHLEVVYMSEAYDSAFADALTRGVTYSFETYTATNAPVTGDGIVHVPISKTSIKAVYSGFINTSMQEGLITNYWQYFNPDLVEYQCKFGAKLVPMEPMKVKNDKGLMSLMMYLKAVNMHYNPLAGFAYGWSIADVSFADKESYGTVSGIDPAVSFGVLGATDCGPSTWCGHTGHGVGRTDLSVLFGNNAATASANSAAVEPQYLSMFHTPTERAVASTKQGLQKRMKQSTWTYHVGAFAIGLDLETEQDAMSGINTAGSTAQLQWSFKFEKNPRSDLVLYTWILHDKALRFEPYGRASVIVD